MSLAQLFYAKNAARQERKAPPRRPRRRKLLRRRRPLLFEPLEPRLLLDAIPALIPRDPLASLIAEQTVAGDVATGAEIDDWTLAVDAGQRLTFVVTADAGLQPGVEARDPSGVSLGTAIAPGAGEDAILQTIEAAEAGTYTFLVSGLDESTGTYTGRVILNAAVEEEGHGGAANGDFASAQDLDGSGLPLLGGGLTRLGVAGVGEGASDHYRFTLGVGEAADLALVSTDDAATLALLDPSGTLLTLGLPDSGHVTRSIADFVAPSPGEYVARVGGAAGAVYDLVVTRGGALDREPNDDPTRAQDLSLTGRALGDVAGPGGDAVDLYVVQARTGDVLVVGTATPGDGAGEPANLLDPALELCDAAGTLLASDDDGATDGRNAALTHTVGADGAYYVGVRGAGETSGVYTLGATGATGGPSTVGPAVIASTPTDGAVLGLPPTAIELVFSEAVRADTVDATDLTLAGPGGAAVTGAMLVGGRTVRFLVDVPATGGTWSWTLAAGAILDLQGNAGASFSGDFALDRTGPAIAATDPAAGDVSAPLQEFIFTFDEGLDPTTVDAFDVTGFTGPTGEDLRGNVESAVTDTAAPERVRVGLSDGLTAPGTYTLTLGPDIADVFGNLMQAPFTAIFTLHVADLRPTALGAPATAFLGGAPSWWTGPS
jgi:hypothetical protein